MTTGAAANPHGAAASQESDPAAHETRVAELRAAMPQWLDAAAAFKPAPSRNPSLPTLVGLLILILCFFVVLTSLSMRDQTREKSVLTGLSQTFAKNGFAPQSPKEAEADSRKLLGDLQAKLNAEVPLVVGVAPQSADDYALNLARSHVFAEDGTSVASGFRGSLTQVMHALRIGPAEGVYEVEIALTAPQMDNKAIAGATAVAAALREAGFANDTASVSLQPGNGEVVGLTIRLRSNARLGPASGQGLGQP